MPRFVYKAKKGPQEIIEGEIDAENEDAALGKISGLGLVPLRLQTLAGSPQEPAHSSQPSPKGVSDAQVTPGPKGGVRVSYKDLNIFTRQFAILLKASVPLMKIFETLQSQASNKKFRQVLQDIQSALREGASLSNALGAYPKIFSQLYINMINSGEISGTMDKVLMRLAEFAEKEAEVRSRVQSAVVYPFFLLLVGIATIFILLTFVMPRLMGLFTDLGTELPLVTRVIIRVSKFSQSYGLWLLGFVAVGAGLLRSRGLSQKQKASVDHFLIHLPILGSLIQKAETANFLRSLELLYENGIPLYQAVNIATRTVSNTAIRQELEKVAPRLEGGGTLANSLKEVVYMTEFVTNMVSVGEESGQLGVAVRETALFYEQETNQFIKMATSLLEPLMILGIGIVVGFIVIAMLLPIFEIHVLAQ